MLRGFVKKIVVADNLTLFVDPIYNAPTNATGAALFIATIAFAFQIYFDFSAYTDIARGCSRVMGLELVPNFRRPYLARSVADFWKRWHISLSMARYAEGRNRVAGRSEGDSRALRRPTLEPPCGRPPPAISIFAKTGAIPNRCDG